MAKEKMAIIGAGKVGTALGHLLQQRGWQVTSCASRTEESLKRAEKYISAFATTDVVEAAARADIIFITTPDDQIESACRQIAVGGGFSSTNVVYHASGALSTEVLKPAAECGAEVGAIHPLQSFATVDQAIKIIPGSVFGVTAEGEVLNLAEQIVADLGGTLVRVRDEDKPLYHAAACVASNYFAAILHYAESLMEKIGLPEDEARKALLPLVKGTSKNVEVLGPTDALTGPIARGDTGTIRKHLRTFEEKLPEEKEFYQVLGRYTTGVATEKGTIDKKKQDELLRILREEGE